MRKCFRATKKDGSRMVKGYIRYNATDYIVYNAIVTLAGVLDAVPLADGSPFLNETKMVFDAAQQWAGFDALAATTYMFENHINATTSMAKLNPGLDVHGKNVGFGQSKGGGGGKKGESEGRKEGSREGAGVNRVRRNSRHSVPLCASTQHLNPPLIGAPDPGLVDYIVKERLFTLFLNDGCIPFTKEHALMERIATNNPWPEPIRVYGYDDSWALA